MNTDLLWTAIIAALEAGDDILTVYNSPDADFGIEKKADNSPLTQADKKAHNRIVSHLEKTPYPILSEEGKHLPYNERSRWQQLWIVDPLDGTKEFIKRNGEFTVNIALVKDNEPIMGVIYVPVKQELYYGLQGKGAYKVTSISASSCAPDLATLETQAQRLPLPVNGKTAFVVVASRSHLSPETETYIEKLRRQHPHVQLVSSGSSIKICLVAEGSADVYPRFAPTMEWDTAAGDAISRAAGRQVLQAGTDQPLVYNKEDLLNPWFIVI